MIENLVFLFLLSAVMILFRIIFSYKHQASQIVRQYKKNNRPFVICSNHISLLDPIFVVMAYGYGRKLTIMGKAELFKNPFLAFIFRSVGAFPVNRGTGDKSAIEKAVNDIKTGRGMLIFPEGTRSKGDEMINLKSGAFMIAAQTKADIIPVRVIYPSKSDRSMHFFSKVRVKFGQPLLIEDTKLDTNSKQEIRNAKILLQNSFDEILKDFNENPF